MRGHRHRLSRKGSLINALIDLWLGFNILFIVQSVCWFPYFVLLLVYLGWLQEPSIYSCCDAACGDAAASGPSKFLEIMLG